MTADYEPLYLRGVEHFNRRHFFVSHEVWEELWLEHQGPSKLYYKGLIQAAVALFHFENGNFHGARKLAEGAHRYLEPYGPKHLGLDIEGFFRAFDAFLAPVWTSEPGRTARVSDQPPPQIHLQPPADAATE